MHLFNMLLITYLFATTIALGLHFVFAAFYQDAVDTGKMWEILDWFMAAAVLISLVVWYNGKIDLDQNRSDNTVSRRYLEVNAGLFATTLLGLWFFWNWFDFLVSGSTPQEEAHQIMWTVIDPLFVLIVGITGLHLCSRRHRSDTVLHR